MRSALVIILPIAGKGSYGERFARTLVGPQVSVLVLHPLPGGADRGVLHTLKGTTKTLTEDVANLRRVLAWVGSSPDVDPTRIGVVGVSRGAIVAALAAELEPRLSTVLILGGAELPGIFRSSRMAIVRRLRESELSMAGGDLDKAVSKAAAILGNVDPATRPGRIDPSRTVLVNARWDRVIPRSSALALREAAGGATQYWLPAGHFSAMAYLPWVRRLARGHFEKTLIGAAEGR